MEEGGEGREVKRGKRGGGAYISYSKKDSRLSLYLFSIVRHFDQLSVVFDLFFSTRIIDISPKAGDY